MYESRKMEDGERNADKFENDVGIKMKEPHGVISQKMIIIKMKLYFRNLVWNSKYKF
jgi:hypothetical protein